MTSPMSSRSIISAASEIMASTVTPCGIGLITSRIVSLTRWSCVRPAREVVISFVIVSPSRFEPAARAVPGPVTPPIRSGKPRCGTPRGSERAPQGTDCRPRLTERAASSGEGPRRRAGWWYSMGRGTTVSWRSPMSEELMTKVQDLIENMINPAVAGHGGFVQLVDVKDNKVYLQMGGGCQGCGAADVTLKQGIERLIKEEIPEITEVLDATDHAAGSNPYYTPGKA